MATEKENGIRAEVPDGTLRALYPDEITRHALIRQVDTYERNGVIEMDRAKTVIQLGEPAIYGALAAIRDQAQAARAPEAVDVQPV